jgi:hypothetical protein
MGGSGAIPTGRPGGGHRVKAPVTPVMDSVSEEGVRSPWPVANQGGCIVDHVVEWNVVVYLDEHDRQTQARAQLTTKDRELAGYGAARCHPFDFDVPEIGDELAAARALSDLAHQLFDAAVGDIGDATQHPAKISS